MSIATPDQVRSYRRRFVAAAAIEGVSALLAGAAVILVLASLGEAGLFPKLVAGISLLAVFLAGQAVRRHFYRCPICGTSLPRSTKRFAPYKFFHTYCRNCRTNFPG